MFCEILLGDVLVLSGFPVSTYADRSASSLRTTKQTPRAPDPTYCSTPESYATVATDDYVRELLRYVSVILADESASNHHMNRKLDRGKSRRPEHRNIRSRMRLRIALSHQRQSRLFRVFDQAVSVHGDRIGLAQEAQLTGLDRRRRHASHRDRLETFLILGNKFVGVASSTARRTSSFTPPPPGIKPTPTSTNPM
jgi:hypothetical protein